MEENEAGFIDWDGNLRLVTVEPREIILETSVEVDNFDGYVHVKTDERLYFDYLSEEDQDIIRKIIEKHVFRARMNFMIRNKQLDHERTCGIKRMDLFGIRFWHPIVSPVSADIVKIDWDFIRDE